MANKYSKVLEMETIEEMCFLSLSSQQEKIMNHFHREDKKYGLTKEVFDAHTFLRIL